MAGCRPRHQGERHGWEWGCSPGHHDADDGDDGDDGDDADDADDADDGCYSDDDRCSADGQVRGELINLQDRIESLPETDKTMITDH